MAAPGSYPAGLVPTGGRRRAWSAQRWAAVALAALVVTGAVVLAVAPPAGSVRSGSPVAGPAHPAAPHVPPPVTYYLAIGASESVGVQPVAGRRRGVPTDEGYANDLLATERARWPGLRLVQVGCPGETAVAAVRGGGPCTYPTGSQLSTAVQFLQAHRPATVLVTVDLGFNDVRRCLDRRSVDPGCVPHALAGIRRVLPGALARLRAAGGRRMRVVGLEHPDPFVARFLGGRTARDFATETLGVFDRLNRVLDAVYRRARVPVANVPRVFGTADRRLTVLAGHGHVPVGVARDCRFTWECPPGPFAGNLHPNAQGYWAIARAVASAVGDAGPAGGGTAR